MAGAIHRLSPVAMLLPSVSEIQNLDAAHVLSANTRVTPTVGDAHPRIVAALSRFGLHRYPVRLVVGTDATLGREPRLDDSYAYRVEINQDGVEVEAATEFGAISACATVAALELDDALPRCGIRDAPEYAWRGLMIDTSRHFMPVAKLEETLELMACYRLNVLHLNLSNDQACRFESARFPALAAPDHYSDADLRHLVAFAADRAIRVVPELDVPGHTTSWVVAYPEWGAATGAVASTGFGVHEACLDPTNPDTLAAVKEVFSELAAIFPDDYVHVGGDEVVATWWDNNDAIQQWMRERDMHSSHDLQTWFIRELGAHLQGLGKRVIGWDEILAERLPQDFTIQAWRSKQARDSAIDAGHATIVSSPYYLDLSYHADNHYRYEPSMPAVAWEQADQENLADPRIAHVREGMSWHTAFGSVATTRARPGGTVLGGEGCMWSEVVDAATLHTRVWSRMPAIAERLWRGEHALDDSSMYERLQASLPHWRERFQISELMTIPAALNPPELHALIEQLEPVKWYARLIGMDRVRARVSGQAESDLRRPYDLQTKLTRLVDFLPPESFAARQVLAELEVGAEIARWRDGWRAQANAWAGCAKAEPKLVELRQVSANLAKLADVQDGKAAIDLQLAEPCGEYLLPIATPILHHAVARLGKFFEIEGAVRELKKGHINDTFVIADQAVIQRINSDIFDVGAVLGNRRLLDATLGDLVPARLTTKDGQDFVVDVAGDAWRAAEYVEARNFDVLPTELCEAAGAGFGKLLTRLRHASVRPESVIPGFHDLNGYLRNLQATQPRENARAALDYVAERRSSAYAFDANEFHVIHGDCKVNNLLFALDAPHVVKIVDLDTLMWGHPAWDFGDLVRSVLTGFPHGDAQHERIQLVAAGFQSMYAVPQRAVEAFARAPAHMSFMLGVRFLTDHLRGDTYFKVTAHGENLARAREQFELAGQLDSIAIRLAEWLS